MMDTRKNISRRRIFKTGLASLATVAVSTPKADAETVIMLGDRAYKMDYTKYKKQEGETKVVYLGGEGTHNGAMQ